MAELAILGYIVGGYPLEEADHSPAPSLTLVLKSSASRWTGFRGLLAGSMALVLAGSVVNQTAIALSPDRVSLEFPVAANLPATSPLATGSQDATTVALASALQSDIAPFNRDYPVADPPPIAPLPVPPQATEPPLGKGRTAAQLKLPPPPPSPAQPNQGNAQVQTQSAPPSVVSSLGQAPPSQDSPPGSYSEAPASIALAGSPSAAKDPALSFDLELVPAAIAPVAASVSPESPVLAALPAMLQAAFAGGADSLVAIAVGSAEGTRTPRGDYTAAYQGHTDPGNGVWNLGTFSYQHGATSPAEADRKQIQQLQRQARQLQQTAANLGLELSLAEQLNGIDLANQSPRAALSRGGYLDRLLEARQQGMTGEAAILWARTRAFLEPDTQRWNAPGLGNTTESITRDQARRMVAVQRAIALNPPKVALTGPSANSATALHAAQSSSSLSEISINRPVAKNTDESVSRLLSFDPP
ncbi:hypothetical protein [Thermoleptolyngbya sp. M55_K2018_002]|uniref:hypothetical protein n=1 Tax=Thermoleptolyngbya sp. M55_K2018_002 TaxID=2747808 RepID=UPI001A0D5A37|nr:hypothetical protein [Thermoleptolyngbya sp. M55_K2018_002]HIK42411.1 hypothetical protein [Thermoleptolyngbya sp. M55_K2018_002]